MSSPFEALSDEQLRTLATLLEGGALVPPLTRQKLAMHGLAAGAGLLAGESCGWSATMLACVARWIVEERAAVARRAPRVEVVWTGPDPAGVGSRDTSVVVRELFESAQRSVLFAGYAIDHGRDILEPLARAIRERGVQVELYLHVPRNEDPSVPDQEHVRRYYDRFLRENWPRDTTPPAVFYDPRTVREYASLHAKCIVVDEERAFVTSANFTERGQERNIEVGLLIHDAAASRVIVGQFRALRSAGFISAV